MISALYKEEETGKTVEIVMKHKLIFVKLLFTLGIMIFSLQAQATISLTPSDCGTTFSCWTTDQTSTLTTSEVESLIGYSGTLDELYKMDVGAGSDTGPYAGSYQTTFSNTATDPSDALIQYISGASITCPDCFLLIKDGNHSPAQYIFDIGIWNGTEDISMTA